MCQYVVPVLDAPKKPALSKAAKKNAKRKEKKQSEATDVDIATQYVNDLRQARNFLASITPLADCQEHV